MEMLSIKDILKKVDELPALSHVTFKVLKLTNNPKTSVTDLADTITQDQVLTIKVLRMANSAYYGYTRKIFSINEAVIILGFSAVRNLVLAASVNKVMTKEFDGYYLSKGELWKHSMATAIIARALAKKVEPNLSDQAFMAGLLHDIGKIILDTYMKNLFQQVIEKVNTEHIPFMDAERLIIGFDHAEVGSQIGEKWNLPEELVESIAKHHNPSEAKINPKLTGLIHVADALSMSMGMGLGGDGMYYPFDGGVSAKLNLTEDVLEETLAELADSLINSDAMLED